MSTFRKGSFLVLAMVAVGIFSSLGCKKKGIDHEWSPSSQESPEIDAAKGSQVLPAGSQAAKAPESATQSFSELAQAAIKAHGKALKGQLKSAMKAGGPAAAVKACSTATAKPRAAEGLTVRRIGTRVRNMAKDTPTAAEASIMDGFTREHGTFEGTVDGKATYMKAIFVTNGMCLKCHGSPQEIDAATKNRLRELYPEDEAVGYQLGDLRGAFVVQRAP